MKKLCTILSIFFVSCWHYVDNSEGFPRPPKHFKFSYKAKATKLNSSDLIDTTAIYYLHNSNYHRKSEEGKNSDHYIRFYSGGRFKIQVVSGFPMIGDVNNINKGFVGYYKMKGNVIKLQVYTDINGGSDQLEFGLIDDDKKLILLHENPRTPFFPRYSEKNMKKKIKYKSFLNPKKYETIKLEGMIYSVPNW